MAEGTAGGQGGQAGGNSGQGQAAGQATQSTQGQNVGQASESVKSESVQTDKPAETAQEKKTRKLLEKAKEFFPDKEFSNDDDLDDHFISKYSELTDYQKRNQEANKKVLETLKAEPKLGDIIRDMSKGMPLHVALAKHVDISKIEPQEGEPDWDAYSKARDERLAKEKEEEAYQETLSKNQELSRKTIKEFFDSKKMDENTVKEFADFVDGIHKKLNDGMIDSDILTAFYNAKNFDSEIAKAKDVASISTKNQEIDLKKADTKKGDGLPTVGQGNKAPEKARERGPLDSVFESIDKKNKILGINN